MLEVVIKRIKHDDDTSISEMWIDGVLECFGIEDEPRVEKVSGETRVPAGKYKLGLRTEGGMHPRYKAIYGDMHKGMICVYNQDNWRLVTTSMSFQYIYIHTGNTDDHTEGCYLTNFAVDLVTMTGSKSRDAYKKVYPIIAEAILTIGATIEYIDLD